MEPTIAIHAARLAAGGISRTQFAKLREEWLAREQKRVGRVGIVNAATEGTRWVFGDALAVMTAENAAAALASLPDAHPLVEASLFSPDMGEPIGRAYLLAGRPEEATSALKRAAGSCAALIGFRPIFATWARFELGKALEARGDAAAACAEYRRVVDRWGAAKPPSRTAAKASARLAALRCAP
jgi:hypothetical protein